MDEGKTITIQSETRSKLTLDHGFRRSQHNFYNTSKYKCGNFVRPLLSGKSIAFIWTIFILTAFIYLPLNIILEKGIKKDDLSEVTLVLRVICSVQAALDIFVYAIPLLFLVQEVAYEDIYSAQYIRIRNIAVTVLVLLIILDCLVLHGVQIKHSGCLKFFLITHWLLFVLTVTGIVFLFYILTDFSAKAIVILFSTILISSAIFLTKIGYKVSLHGIFLSQSKTNLKNNKISPVESHSANTH